MVIASTVRPPCRARAAKAKNFGWVIGSPKPLKFTVPIEGISPSWVRIAVNVSSDMAPPGVSHE